MLKMEIEINFGLSVVCRFLSGTQLMSGKEEPDLSAVLKLQTCSLQGQAQFEDRWFGNKHEREASSC